MSFVITWAHRNRVSQADQLIPWVSASIAPEAEAHYALEVRDSADVLLAQKLDISGTTATVSSPLTGILKFILWTIRDGYDSREKWLGTVTVITPDAVGSTTIAASTWVAGPGDIIDGGGA